ncbi:MAG TPA: hypothetical protein VIW03_17455, partial [Anaeromyxobacter sp.]
VGYSVSSYTGVRKAGEVQAHGNPKEAAKAAAAPAAPGGGYGGAERPAAGGGYGAPEKPAAKPPVKPAAAGY